MLGVRIEKGISDWQILQQQNGQADAKLGGTFEQKNPGKETQIFVRVVLEDTGDIVCFWEKAVVDEEQKNWSICLKKIPAGGLYRVETCMKETPETSYEWGIRGDMVHHVGVGDVFALAGQSNSAGYGKDSVYDPPELGVHLYKNSDRWDLASHPLNDSTGTRHQVNTEEVNSGHSPWLSFGKYMKRYLGYPIGLIQTALGGSPLSAWNPEEEGYLYENMVERIHSQGGKIKGVLWYQGCSDTMGGELTNEYGSRFANMVQSLRLRLQDENLPFFTLQLSRNMTKPMHTESSQAWSLVREAQREVAKLIPFIYVLPTIDGMLSDMIHNSASFNLVLGERIAKQALAKLYGIPTLCDAPDLTAAVWEKDRLILCFAPVYDYLYAFEMEPDELPIIIEDEKGRLEIEAYHMCKSSKIELVTVRKPHGETWIYCYFGANPKEHCIVDYATHYPILGFSVRIDIN